MLTPGEKYYAARDLPTFDSDARLPANVELIATAKDELTNERTGEVFRLMTFQAIRSDWFFQRTTGFNPERPTVPTLKELVFGAVRAYPDLMREELYARIMDCNPRAKGFTIDTMSGVLADDPRIEMFKDGVQVQKVGHNQRYCTFRPKGWKP